MHLDDFLTGAELVRDLLVEQALRDELADFPLAPGQSGKPGLDFAPGLALQLQGRRARAGALESPRAAAARRAV